MRSPPIGRALRAARTLAGVSQAVVSESMGVSKAAVAAWETGSRRVSMSQVALWTHVCGLSQQQMGALLDAALELAAAGPAGAGDAGPGTQPRLAVKAGAGCVTTVSPGPSVAVTPGVVFPLGVDDVVSVDRADQGLGGHDAPPVVESGRLKSPTDGTKRTDQYGTTITNAQGVPA